MRSPHRDRDADAALGHAIALGYAQGPGAWGANHIIMPDGARFSMLEADPMTVPGDALRQIKVKATVFAGDPYPTP